MSGLFILGLTLKVKFPQLEEVFLNFLIYKIINSLLFRVQSVVLPKSLKPENLEC